MTNSTQASGPNEEAADTVERRGDILPMGPNRPSKRNAFDLAMLERLSAAYYVKTTIYLVDMNDFAAVNTPKGSRVEVEVLAYLDP